MNEKISRQKVRITERKFLEKFDAVNLYKAVMNSYNYPRNECSAHYPVGKERWGFKGGGNKVGVLNFKPKASIFIMFHKFQLQSSSTNHVW